MDGDFNFGKFGQDLAYDLRAVYAKIVGEHLEDVALARKKDNYYNYFKSLRDVYVITQHKFKDKKIEEVINGKKISKSYGEKFEELMGLAVATANKYPNDWIGKSKNPEACALIEKTLNDIEMFLYERIDEANIFGSSRQIQGL